MTCYLDDVKAPYDIDDDDLTWSICC